MTIGQHNTNDIRSFKKLARTISIVENEAAGYEDILKRLPFSTDSKIIGITGPPGAGKSTLTDALIEQLVKQQKRVAILCVDPSSPYHHGALLGDRIRMNAWYNEPLVYIRSLASRGSLGGLSPKIIEITDVLKAYSFDYIIIETVGVGQSEVEIAGLADVTVVVLNPGAGDEVQIMKAGLIEIADVFVINKSDRSDADSLVNDLMLMQKARHQKTDTLKPVIKTIATEKTGIEELLQAINQQIETSRSDNKRYFLLAEKACQLILKRRMSGINKTAIAELIKEDSAKKEFNLYRWVESFEKQV